MSRGAQGRSAAISERVAYRFLDWDGLKRTFNGMVEKFNGETVLIDEVGPWPEEKA